MTQTGSGAYLGGIGTMLSQNEVCPECGQVHKERRIGSFLVAHRRCPLVVLGAFPTVTQPPETDEPVEPLEVEVLPQTARRGSQLTIPWPMPTQWEDYL